MISMDKVVKPIFFLLQVFIISISAELTEPTTNLPPFVDNSIHKAFRPIFNQAGTSCSQATAVGYIYTYEINCQRGLSADVPQNQYPYDFIFNFLNRGKSAQSTDPRMGWELIRDIGIPSVADYGGFGLGKYSQWISGYPIYLKGMENRLKEVFSIKICSAKDLLTAKQWLLNHGNGFTTGGCLEFSGSVHDMQIVTLPDSSLDYNKAIVRFGKTGGHTMAIVGYNDSVRYDYNNDGKFTNDIDINNDGIVDIKDWEIGAMLMVNSWGLSWGDNGRAYVMYKLLLDSASHGGIWGPYLGGIRLYDEPIIKPSIAMKFSISHPERSKIKIVAGSSTDTASLTNPKTIPLSSIIYFSGGPFPMQGINNEPLEFGLDCSKLLIDPEDSTRAFYLSIYAGDKRGILHKISLMDYTSTPFTEYLYPHENVILDSGTTYFKIIRPASAQSISKRPKPPATHNISSSFQIKNGIITVLNYNNFVKIFSLDGKTVMSLLQVNSKSTIDISRFKNGVYFLVYQHGCLKLPVKM
jgi:hypothetical protein